MILDRKRLVERLSREIEFDLIEEGVVELETQIMVGHGEELFDEELL